MVSSIIQALFLIRIQLNTSEQKKKRQRICDLPYAETNRKFLYPPNTLQRKIFLQKKRFLRKRESGLLNKND